MSVSIVWLDDDNAKIYHFSEDRMEREALRMGLNTNQNNEAIANQLQNSKQVLILSPGSAGERLVENLQMRFPEIARRVVGCETLSSADDVAVASYAIKYFRKPVTRPVS